MKNFDQWIKLKKNVDTTYKERAAFAGEVWWCSIGINIGSEIDGKNEMFERPVLILRWFNIGTVLIIPLSSQLEKSEFVYSWKYRGTEYFVILSKLRLISSQRLLQKIFTLEKNLFEEIRIRVKEMI